MIVFFFLVIGHSKKPTVGIVVGIVGGFIVLFLLGVLFVTCKRRNKGYKREIYVDVPGVCD